MVLACDARRSEHYLLDEYLSDIVPIQTAIRADSQPVTNRGPSTASVKHKATPQFRKSFTFGRSLVRAKERHEILRGNRQATIAAIADLQAQIEAETKMSLAYRRPETDFIRANVQAAPHVRHKKIKANQPQKQRDNIPVINNYQSVKQLYLSSCERTCTQALL